jgi:hypothetical protein
MWVPSSGKTEGKQQAIAQNGLKLARGHMARIRLQNRIRL